MFIIIFLKKRIGALTNKSYAFQNRPWDLNYINSIDIFDSLASNIRIYLYGAEIKRILPLKNDLINEDWISNRSRYFFEGFFGTKIIGSNPITRTLRNGIWCIKLLKIVVLKTNILPLNYFELK